MLFRSVLSEDAEAGEQSYQQVLQTYINESDTLIHVVTSKDEIETTPMHPFYVIGRGFVPAGELEAGDKLKDSEGQETEVVDVWSEVLDEPVLVYNLEVEDSHTYYVGAGMVLVHNDCTLPVGTSKPGDSTDLSMDKGTGNYLATPATKNGTLNIGAGTKPIEGAYNIDINPQVIGVYAGNAADLSSIATNSQSKISMENPYKYNPLNSEVYRVLESGGTVNITGNMSNKYFNSVYKMTDVELKGAGYEIISRGAAANATTAYTTSGQPIKGTIMEIILRKH